MQAGNSWARAKNKLSARLHAAQHPKAFWSKNVLLRHALEKHWVCVCVLPGPMLSSSHRPSPFQAGSCRHRQAPDACGMPAFGFLRVLVCLPDEPDPESGRSGRLPRAPRKHKGARLSPLASMYNATMSCSILRCTFPQLVAWKPLKVTFSEHKEHHGGARRMTAPLASSCIHIAQGGGQSDSELHAWMPASSRGPGIVAFSAHVGIRMTLNARSLLGPQKQPVVFCTEILLEAVLTISFQDSSSCSSSACRSAFRMPKLASYHAAPRNLQPDLRRKRTQKESILCTTARPRRWQSLHWVDPGL